MSQRLSSHADDSA
ncbi:hypothetical protein Tco_0419475, partial [Tanacetum coccineum]